MEDIRTATVALKALVELGYPLELSSLIDYLAKSPDSRDELVKFDNEDTLSIFLKKFPSMFWVDGCKVFPAQLKPKGVSKCSNKTRPPQSHSVVQPATDLSDERREEDQLMGEVEEPEEYKNGTPKGNTKISCSGEKKEAKLTESKVGRLDTEDNGAKERNVSKEDVNSKKNGKGSKVNQGKVGQEEDESTLNLECSAKQKTEEVLNDATTVPSTSALHTCHALESQESQQQFPTCESTKESAYMTAMRNLFTKQRKLSIVTIVEKLRAVYSEDKIDEGAARLFLKRYPDMYQLTEDDKVEEQAPVNVMATILKVLKWNALGTLEDGSQVYIPKALYAERMGVACASMRDHLSKGDCILVDTEQGMTSRTAKWTATNIRAIFKSPNVHISNERTKKIDLHTAVPHMLATKAIRSPSELDDVILNFVITIFDKRTECTLQHLNYNMRYLNHDGLLHLRGSGGLLKFLQGHPDKFQIVHTHSVSVNQEHSQFCTNPSNLHLDAECAISEESAMETVVKGTLHQGDKTSSSHSDLSSNPDNQATSESMVTVHKIVDADNIHAQADSATPSIETNCVIGEIHCIVDDFILFYLQNGEKALLSGLKKMQKDTTTNAECLSVGDCILLDVVPGPPGGTQWTVSKMRHTLKKVVPSQIQCSESTATHGNVALKEVLEQLEEQLDTVLAWFTAVGKKVRVSFKDLEAGMGDLPKNVEKFTLQKAGPIQFLEQYPSLFHVDTIRSEVCLVECPHTSSTCCGATCMLVPKSSSDQDKGVATVKPPIEGTSVAGHVIATDSSEPRVAAIDQAAVEFFRNKVSEKGKLSIHDLSSCFAACPMAIRKHVGSSEKGLIKFFKDHADTFLLENEKVVSLMDTSARAMEEAKHDKTAKETVAALSDDKRTADGKNIDVATPSPMSSSRGDSDVIEREALSGTQDVDALLEEGVAHFVEVLKKKGSMPINRIHGHVNQLREEVKKAIGSGQENVRALFLRFPAYFSIDATDAVHLAPKQQEEKEDSKQTEGDVNSKSDASLLEEGAAHFVAVLEKKGSMPLSNISGHVCQCREEVKQAVGSGPEKARALFLRFPAYFFLDATDTVHLACKQQEETEASQSKQRQSDIKSEAALLEEGAAHFVAVLKKKGSLTLNRIHGHITECKREVWKAVGGGSENARSLFLKFPSYFHIDAEENVHLTSAITQECVKAVSAVLERKGPTHLGELVSHAGFSEPKMSSYFQRNSPKTFLEQHPKIFVIDDNMVYLVSAIKEEGVQHFKKVLELKGSLHIKNLSGHSSQYKYLDPMLKIIGGVPSSVMDFLKGSPEVFSISDDGMVHLRSASITQSQGNKSGTDNRSYAMVVETGQKIHLEDKKAKKEGILLEGVQHFKQALESKGSMPVQNIFGHVNQCRNEVKWAIGTSMDNVKKFLQRYPGVFHIDKNLMVHLVCNRVQGQQQEQQKTNIKQLQIEEKALAHFKGMLSRKGPSTIHVLSSCFHSCIEDIRKHVGSSEEELTKFLKKYPQIFKVDANKVVSLCVKGMVFKPQRWASCDTLTVPHDTVFPKVLSKLSGSTPDVRSAVCEATLQQAEEVQDKPSQQPEEGHKDKNETGDGASTCTSMPCPQTQHTPDQNADSSNDILDKFVSAAKNILSENRCLHIAQFVKELGTMLPHERFELSGVRLLLKKCPEDFHVNDQDIVEKLPPMNVFAVVNKMLGNNSCFATMEDTSIVYVHIALYRERMGVDCTRLQDHLSTGDILLVDTEHGTPGSSSKWTATNIRAVFKSPKSVDADKNGVNFQTPMPFLPATTIIRSPSEICGAIVKLVASSTLHVKDLSSRMKYLNHDAVLYLREKGGLLSFLQSQPQLFLVQDKCVTLVAGEGELDEGTSQCLASPGARCTIGEVSVISKNIAHLHLPDDKEAILDLTDSITTSHLSVGDCLVAYIVPSNQSEIPWEVSEVKCVMGKAVPAHVHAKTATATCGSHLLKYVLQQCVLEEEVDTVLAWHRLLSQTTQVTFEEVEECLKGLSQKSKMHTLQQGVPCEFFEKYPTLFHVDRFRKAVSLVECSPMSKTLFVGDVKHVKSPPAQVEGNTQPATEKPPPGLENSLASAADLDTDKDAVEFFKSMVFAKGQVSLQVLSTCFDACPTAIRQHVGSSMKGLAVFLRDHPDTFSLDENNMMCTLKNTFKTVKQGRETDQLSQKAIAYFKAILSKKGPLTIHVLSSGFGPCPKNIRSHVGSSKVGLTNFFLDHPEIFTVDKDQVVSLTDKASAAVDPSLPPNKDGGDNLDCNYLSDGVRLVDAQEQHQHPTRIQALEVDTNDASKEKQTSDHAKEARDQSSPNCRIGSALLQEGSELSTEVQEDGDISTVEDASKSSCPQSPNPPVLHSSEEQHLEDQADQEPEQEDQAEIEKETLELIVNLIWNCGQVSLRSLQGHINLLGEEKKDCIKDKGGLLTFLQHHYGQIFKIDSASEHVSLWGIQVEQKAELDFLMDSSAKGEQLQPKQLTVEEEVETVGSSLEKTLISVDISDTENSKKNHNVPMKETEDDTATSLLKIKHDTDVDFSTAVTPSVLVAQETDIVSLPIPTAQSPNPLLEQYLNEQEAVCDSSGLPTATVHPVVPLDNPPGQPDDDFTSLLHMFKDNLSPIQDNLVEVEMDIGRIPIARYYNPASPNLLAPLRLSEETLTRETLETILSALPLDRSATGQGRVLLRGSLHWVSTLKNSSDDIVGLTLRRGQAVPGCLDLLWDMVTSGTSTLIIGRPCSGKTTLLREWARVLSDVCYRRVIVVDTLNEIAGGDDVPHPGVGGARRVQVHNRCQQVSQLQTAARNHSPDCIIVDEVQTQEEVTALQAIRLTGIQVIAGVCAGSLPDLLHNSVMRGLLGMSDPPSTASASRGVSPQPPTFPQALPVFQAAVQIHNRDNLSVYSDVASFVRMSLLEGRFPLAQQRKRVVTSGRKTEL